MDQIGREDRLQEVSDDKFSVADDYPAGRLHPRIRHHYPECGKHPAQNHHCRGEQMHRRGHAVPAEHHNAEKSCLGGESKHRLKTEDIADEISRCNGKRAPIGTEREFHGKSRYHADPEIEQKDAAPEAGLAVVVRLSGAQPHSLPPEQYQRETDGEGWPEDVECGDECKLRPREEGGIEPRVH